MVSKESNKSKGLHFEYESLTYSDEIQSNEEMLREYRRTLNSKLRERKKIRDGSFEEDIERDYNPLGVRPSPIAKFSILDNLGAIKRIAIVTVVIIGSIIFIFNSGLFGKEKYEDVYIPGQEEKVGWFSEKDDGNWYKNIEANDNYDYSVAFKIIDEDVEHKIVNLVISKPTIQQYAKKQSGKSGESKYVIYIKVPAGVYNVATNDESGYTKNVVGEIVKDSFATHDRDSNKLVKGKIYTINNLPDDDEEYYYTCEKISDIKSGKNISIKSGQIIKAYYTDSKVIPIILSKVNSRTIFNTDKNE